jgi:hypothetical protein
MTANYLRFLANLVSVSFAPVFLMPSLLRYLSSTVRLTSTAHPVPGNQEFCLAPSETIVELVKKIRSLTWGIV